MISKLCFTILTVISFLPLFLQLNVRQNRVQIQQKTTELPTNLPCIISEFTRRSTIGQEAFLKRFAAYLVRGGSGGATLKFR